MLKRVKGFSIIELLVVVIAMAILLAIGIPNLMRFLPTQRLSGGTNQLIGDLRLARHKAIAEGNDFVVSYTALTSDYSIHDNDDSDRPPGIDGGEEVVDRQLPSQVRFDSTGTFAFKSDGTVIEPDGSPVSAFYIVLKNQREEEESVAVLASGMVMK